MGCLSFRTVNPDDGEAPKKKIQFTQATYKYQLEKDYSVNIPIKDHDIDLTFLALDPTGMLLIRKGYAWDGPSGPTVDTPGFMRGALVHDSLYQLMRGEHLHDKKYRKVADEIMRKICREDGMNSFRAWYVYYGTDHDSVHTVPTHHTSASYTGVRIGGESSASEENKRKVFQAP